MNNLGFIDELVLLGFKGGKEKGLTAADITKALTPFLDRRNSDLLAALQRLAADGRVEELPHQKRQRSKRWRLPKSEGDASQKPTRGRSSKQRVIRDLVAKHLLKLEPRAAAAVVEADGIFAYYLAGRLGEVFDANTTVAGLASLVAAKSLNLSRGDLDFVWQRLVQNGLEAKESTEPVAAFAEQVKRAARNANDGWFGPRKLFIHRAWEAWKTSSGESVDLPAFKQRLLQALRAGYIELSRVDYPMGLDASDIDTALTHYGDEIFHFVTVDKEARP